MPPAAPERVAHDPSRLPAEIAALLREDLYEFFAAPRASSASATPSTRYALIDAILCPPDYVFELGDAHGLNFTAVFLGTAEAAYHKKGPFLLQLPDDPLERNHPLIAALAETPGLKQALTLIESPLPLPELCAWLRAWLKAELDDGARILLRWFDARIGITLLQTLPPELSGRFLSPFRHWHAWDWNYRPRRLSGPTRPAPEKIPEPIRIDPATLKTLGAISTVQETIHYLDTEDPTPRPEIAPLPMLPALRHYVAECELDTIRRMGLSLSRNDRLSALWFALHAHPRFWQDPDLREKARRRYLKENSLDWLISDPSFYDFAHRSGDAARALAEAGEAFLAEARADRQALRRPDGR